MSQSITSPEKSKRTMKPYNGHRSWNAWNVSLWIHNDEGLYNFAIDCIKRSKTLGGAVRLFMADYQGQKTPDGAAYNRLSVRLCLESLRSGM